MKTVQATLPWFVEPTPTTHRRVKTHYGKRDTRCQQCKKLLRADDINEAGICLWCEYDNAMAIPDISLVSSSHKDVTAPIV